jgi:hypothetical protein
MPGIIGGAQPGIIGGAQSGIVGGAQPGDCRRGAAGDCRRGAAGDCRRGAAGGFRRDAAGCFCTQLCVGEVQLKNSSAPSASSARDDENSLRALCEIDSISYRQAFIGEVQLKNSSAPSASSARDDENPRKKQQMYVTMCDMDERSIAYVDIDEYPIKSSPSRGTT